MHKSESGRWVPDPAPKQAAATESPWGEDGQLRLPGWIEQAGPMPETWPVMMFWAEAGRAALAGDGCNDAAGSKVAQVRSGLDLPDQSQSNSPSTV